MATRERKLLMTTVALSLLLSAATTTAANSWVLWWRYETRGMGFDPLTAASLSKWHRTTYDTEQACEHASGELVRLSDQVRAAGGALTLLARCVPEGVEPSGLRQYCAADYSSVPPSARPYRWCEYEDMASCLDATRDRRNYSCEQNQFWEGR